LYRKVRNLESRNDKLKRKLEDLTTKYNFLCGKKKTLNSISLEEDEEDEAVKLLKKCLNCYGDNWRKTFHYTFITQQMTALVTDPRGMRWNPAVLDFFGTISYYGGKKVYNLLRGGAYEGQGKKGRLDKDAKKFNLFIPSLATLRKNLPKVDPYASKDNVPFKAQNLQKMFQNLPEWKDQQFVGGLAYDEIEIRRGLIYLKHSKILIGLAKGPILVSGLDKAISEVDYTKQLAKKVCQCFFVSNCGRICMPIHYFPTHSLTATELINVNKYLCDELKKCSISISWTTTDGFKGSLKFKDKSPAFHIFDYVHMVKLGRNQLLNRMIRVKNEVGYVHFSMKDLLSWWMNSPFLQKHFTLDDLHPSDKQDINPVKNILNKISIIRQFGATQGGDIEVKAACLANYLDKLNELYQLFSDNEIPIKTKLTKVEELKKYFADWKKEDIPEYNFITTDLFGQISTTLDGFSQLFSDKTSSINLSFTSILGTNIVENYFSIIRGKVMYPNLWEYACVSNRAFVELVKRFQVDREWSIPSRPLSKTAKLKYNDQSGIVFTREDHIFLFQCPPSSPPSTDIEMITDTQNYLALDLCEKYKPTRKRLTIRQKTCKQEEGELLTVQRKGDTDLGIFLCFDPNCAKHFQMAGVYRNHLKIDHDISFEGGQDELFHYKGPENYVSIPKTTPEKMVPDGIIELRQDATPCTIGDEQKSEEEIMNRNDRKDDEVVAVVFWDVETTGKHQGSSEEYILEIGSVAMMRDNEDEFKFNQLINPFQFPRQQQHGFITSQAFRVHGIGASSAKLCKKWGEVFPQWVEYLSCLRKNGKGKVLMLAHNSKSADYNALKWDCDRYGLSVPTFLM
jgi:hypothetical protein